jgi:ATP-dependent 26S proteasome regulatory subunit
VSAICSLYPSLVNLLTKVYSGLFAIKDYRDSINQDDFSKAVRKVSESKKLEGKLEYQKL